MRKTLLATFAVALSACSSITEPTPRPIAPTKPHYGFVISAGDKLVCIDTSTGQEVDMSYCTGET